MEMGRAWLVILLLTTATGQSIGSVRRVGDVTYIKDESLGDRGFHPEVRGWKRSSTDLMDNTLQLLGADSAIIRRKLVTKLETSASRMKRVIAELLLYQSDITDILRLQKQLVQMQQLSTNPDRTRLTRNGDRFEPMLFKTRKKNYTGKKPRQYNANDHMGDKFDVADQTFTDITYSQTSNTADEPRLMTSGKRNVILADYIANTNSDDVHRPFAYAGLSESVGKTGIPKGDVDNIYNSPESVPDDIMYVDAGANDDNRIFHDANIAIDDEQHIIENDGRMFADADRTTDDVVGTIDDVDLNVNDVNHRVNDVDRAIDDQTLSKRSNALADIGVFTRDRRRRRHFLYCNKRRMTIQDVISYLRTGRICGRRAMSMRFGLGR